MKQPIFKLLLASLLLLGVNFLCCASYAQQSVTPAQATQPAADVIVGGWKLEIEKSTNPSYESALMTITAQGDQVQIIFRATQSNGYNTHYQVITDMKGATSKLVQTDGRPMSDEWRIARSQPNAFVVESVGPGGGWKKEYAVSEDGKTLTVRELPGHPNLIVGKMDSNGVIHPVQRVLVFEKISDSEARTLSKEMTDSDAAQQALAAEKAAALGASDAKGCELAPGQSGAPRPMDRPQVWNEYVCPKDGFAITVPNAPKKQSLQQSTSYNLFLAEDESIVARLYVSVEPADCTAWLSEMRAMVNRPLSPGAIHMTKETTFEGRPAFESLDPRGNGPMYLLYDLHQCSGNRTYWFHARWLTDQPKPEEVTRIFNSFRLLTKEEKQ